MNEPTRSPAGVADELALDHEHVEELVARLRSSTELASLVAVLEKLDKVLVAHFAHEENPGGIYDVMRTTNPELRAPLGDLLGEHYTLLMEIRSLAARGREILERSHVDLHAEARALADRLMAHEAREDAIAEDRLRIGPGD